MSSDSLIYKLAVYLDLTGVPYLGHGPAVTDEAVHVLGEGAILDTLPEHGDWQLDQRLRRQGPGVPVIVAVPHPDDHEKFLLSAILIKIPFSPHLRTSGLSCLGETVGPVLTDVYHHSSE